VCEPIAGIAVAEQLGRVPRRLRFVRGGYCEISDQPGLAGLLQQLGHRDSPVERWQRDTGIALASLCILVLLAAATYRWILPEAAEVLAARIPEEVVESLSDQTLRQLDKTVLKESTMDPDRQMMLMRRYARLRKPPAVFHEGLMFRSSPLLGANALSLLDGRIVMLDGLVALADNDEQLLAVMAHEYAHAQLRHSLRQLVRTTAVGTITAWWIGDFSTMLAAAPAMFAQLHYSRQLETEADDYAADLLQDNGIVWRRFCRNCNPRLATAIGVRMPKPRSATTWRRIPARVRVCGGSGIASDRLSQRAAAAGTDHGRDRVRQDRAVAGVGRAL
jgi:Zn-dependent protease with chaperone function